MIGTIDWSSVGFETNGVLSEFACFASAKKSVEITGERTTALKNATGNGCPRFLFTLERRRCGQILDGPELQA